jgi:hypothetical protein
MSRDGIAMAERAQRHEAAVVRMLGALPMVGDQLKP